MCVKDVILCSSCCSNTFLASAHRVSQKNFQTFSEDNIPSNNTFFEIHYIIHADLCIRGKICINFIQDQMLSVLALNYVMFKT